MQQGSGHRYILGDPSFSSFSGHCYEYIRSLEVYLKAQGHRVIIAGNRGMSGEVADKSGAYGVFTYWCDARPLPPGIGGASWLGRQIVRWKHERSVLKDLQEFDQRIAISSTDTVVLNTFRHWGLRGIVRWLDSLPQGRAPKIVLILHFTAFQVPGAAINDRQMYKDAFAAIEASPNRDRISLMADSAGLVSEYRAISPLDFKLAPIPHTKTAAPITVAAQNADGGDSQSAPEPIRSLTITYAGEARINKGFQFLPYVVETLEATQTKRPWQFEIQSFIHDPGQRFYQLAMSKLKLSKHCIFLDTQLNDAEYDAFMIRSDIVLVPYLLDNYHIQTSGIYAEAVSLGKPVIVPMGSWMAAQVRAYGGGLTFPPGDQRALYEAVAEMIENYDSFKQAAIDAAAAWHRFHTADNLVSLINGEKGASL